MARNYKPKRFTKIGLLKKMDFPLLLRLLEPYRLYFEGHPDFVWAATSDQFRFDVLAEVMLNLDTTIPKDLLESLYYIETMADNDYFDELYSFPISKCSLTAKIRKTSLLPLHPVNWSIRNI